MTNVTLLYGAQFFLDDCEQIDCRNHPVMRLMRLALGALLSAFVCSVSASPLFSVTDLGTLPGGFPFSSAGGIAPNGFVTGNAGVPGTSHAFLWDPNTKSMRDIHTDPFGGDGSFGLAVNSAGQVTGESVSSSTAFLWNPTTQHMEDLGLGTLSRGVAINEVGQITGSYRAETGTRAYFLDTRTGSFDDIDPFRGSNGVDINEDGLVLANAAIVIGTFVWDPMSGTTNLLAPPPGSNCSSGAAINDLGLVAGTFCKETGNRAFIWDSSADAILHELDPLTGDRATEAADINNLGHVVGRSYDESGGFRPFLWTPALGTLDLNDLLDLSEAFDAEFLSFSLTTAVGLNDKGQIVGRGTYTTAEGLFRRAFLLTPMQAPEPATLVLMALGLVSLWVVRGRQLAWTREVI